jgi:hypothetical protein
MKRVALCDQFISDHDEFRGDISTDEKTRRQWPRTRLQTVGYCRNFLWICIGGDRKRETLWCLVCSISNGG